MNPDKSELVLLSRRNKFSGPLKPIQLFGKTLSYSDTVKYLGVILDNRLRWNSHVDYVVKKAKTVFWSYRSLTGRNWGLKNEYIAWIYTALVRSLISYVAVVWWERTTIKLVIINFSFFVI